jgi:PAS domain S-box-containing protein
MACIMILLFLTIAGLAALSVWLFLDRRRIQARLARLSSTARSKKGEYQQLESQRLQEVEARRQTEDKLRQYLQLMDTLVNTIPNPIYFRDVDGVFRGCNRAFEQQILGGSRETIIGRHPRDLVDRMPRDFFASLQQRELLLAHESKTAPIEAQVTCADGRMREFLMTVAHIEDDHDENAGTVGVMLDLTEKNRAARERAQREKFEGVLETAGAVCHEMNQPLQVILGYAELLLNETGEGARWHSLAERIRGQVERMADITGKLQKITRYETMDYGEHARIIDIHKSSRR